MPQKRLQKLIDFFEHPLKSLNEEVEQQLNLVVVTLAQQLVRRELKIEPSERKTRGMVNPRLNSSGIVLPSKIPLSVEVCHVSHRVIPLPRR